MKPTLLLLTSLSAVGLLAAGCSTSNDVATTEQEPSYLGIGFENTGQWDPTVAPSGEDVEDVTRFAVALSQRGQHEDAAYLLESKAGEIESRRNELNIELYHMAANEYLKAGDRVGFTRSLDAAEELADRYQRAAWDSPTRRLYELRDAYRPAEMPTPEDGLESAYVPVVSPDRASDS